MNPFRWSFRKQFLLGFACCAALLGYAFYVQFHLRIQPCPFCIFQRIAFAALGLAFLAGGLAAPRSQGARKAWSLLALVPDTVLESMAGSVVNSDVQASNVPGYPGDTYIAGAKVLRHYGIGPLPGVAMMAVLMSRGGWVTISTRYDRASIDDSELWARCLLEGFDEILALGGDGRAIPASFGEQSAPVTDGGVAQ